MNADAKGPPTCSAARGFVRCSLPAGHDAPAVNTKHRSGDNLWEWNTGEEMEPVQQAPEGTLGTCDLRLYIGMRQERDRWRADCSSARAELGRARQSRMDDATKKLMHNAIDLLTSEDRDDDEIGALVERIYAVLARGES